MNIRQENSFRMHETVDTVLTRNNAKWAANTKFSAKVGSHRITLQAIRLKINQQSSASAGAVAGRDNSLNKMADKAVVAAAALLLRAEETGDEHLQEIASITPSDLKQGPHEEAYNTVKLLIDTIEPLIAELVDFEYTAADFDELKASVDEYHSDLGATYDGMVLQKAATSSIPELLDEADGYLHSMDLHIKLIGRREPEFAAEYLAAREIKDLGIHHEEEVTPAPEPINQ